MSKSIRLNVYGKYIQARKSDHGWELFYIGGEGKSRPAYDLIVPEFITEVELIDYLSDLCHEWATEKNPRVFRTDSGD